MWIDHFVQCNMSSSHRNYLPYLHIKFSHIYFYSYAYRIYSFHLFFYWSIKTLQFCISFCCTTKWISCIYTYIRSLFAFPPTLCPTTSYSPSHSSSSPRSTESKSPCLFSSFPLAIYFTYGDVYMSILISQFVPPSPSPSGSACPFSTSVSLFPPCK